MIYRYEQRGRRWAVVLPVAATWIAVTVGILVLNLVWWIAIPVLLFTLPALLDVIRDTTASVEVWPDRIVWVSALRNGDRNDIDHVRLNRRFDGGMKITLVHIGGSHTRLPPDVAPPVEAFQEALKQAGLASERHPFSPF